MIYYFSTTRRRQVGYTLGYCQDCQQVQPMSCFYIRTFRWIVVVPITNRTPVKFSTCEVCNLNIDYGEELHGCQTWSPENGIPALAKSIDFPASELPSSPITEQSAHAVLTNAVSGKRQMPASIVLWPAIATAVVAYSMSKLTENGVTILEMDEVVARFVPAAFTLALGTMVSASIWTFKNSGNRLARQRIAAVIQKFPSNKMAWFKAAERHPKIRKHIDDIVRGFT